MDAHNELRSLKSEAQEFFREAWTDTLPANQSNIARMFPQLGVPLPPTSDDEHTAAARQFMKAVSRREIHSVNGPDRAGFRSVNNEPPMKPLGSGEDYRPPNPFLPNQRWHGTSEGADHAHRVMLRKIRGHKFSQEELSVAFQYFLQSSDAAALEKDAFRWETLIDLKDIIKEQAPKVPLAGRDSGVYEMFFRSEPGQFMNRPRFMIAMRQVFGFQTANNDQASDGRALWVLDRTYRAFDMHEKGAFDWRLFLVMYRVVHLPLVLFRDHLVFGFGIYASSGSYDFGNSSASDKKRSKGGGVDPALTVDCGVKYGDVRSMFSALTSQPLRELLLDLVETAWHELAEVSTQLNVQVQAARRAGKRSDEVCMTRAQFDKLLDCPALAPLFEAAITFGSHDPAVWTMVIEEHFAEPGLLAFIKPYRREVYTTSKAKQFLAGFITRTRRRNVKRWRLYCMRRQRCRYLVAHTAARWRVLNTLDALYKWRRFAIVECSAITLQRYTRGWMGRLARWFIKEMERTVVTIQTKYRSLRARRFYMEVVARRHWAVTEIARFVRGNAAKRLAMNKLETHLWKMHAKLAQERFEFENSELIKAAKLVQKCWRDKEAREKAAASMEKARNEKIVREMKESMEHDNVSKRKLFEKELEMYFKEEKRKVFEGGAAADVRDKQEIDRARYKRQEKERELAKKRKERQTKADDEKDRELEAWLSKWAEKEVARAAAITKHLTRILNEAETKEERAERKQLLKEIKVQSKDVLARAKVAGLRMEDPEAEQVAAKEVIELHAEEAKKEVKKEMQVAAAAIQSKEAEEKEETNKHQEREDSMKAASAAKTWQLCYRKWAGRVQLRQRLYEVIARRFIGGAQGFGFEYEDLRTEELLEGKPLLFGKFDVYLPDSWHFIADPAAHLTEAEQGRGYYYNPGTLDMQWTQPYGTVACEECHEDLVRRWELPPLPEKGAPLDKAKIKSVFTGGGMKMGATAAAAPAVPQEELGRMLCVSCWEKAHPWGLGIEGNTLAERVRKLRWIDFNGGSTNAQALLESGNAAIGDPKTEASLPLRYLNEHFYDDESPSSAAVYEKAVVATQKRCQAARDRMMRANDEGHPMSEGMKQEKAFFKRKQQKLRNMDTREKKPRRIPVDGDSTLAETQEADDMTLGDSIGSSGEGDEADLLPVEAATWSEQWDQASQAPYWSNESTGETVWENPYSTGDHENAEMALAAITYCEHCAEAAALRWCEGCEQSFCAECFMDLHAKDPAKKTHKFHKI